MVFLDRLEREFVMVTESALGQVVAPDPCMRHVLVAKDVRLRMEAPVVLSDVDALASQRAHSPAPLIVRTPILIHGAYDHPDRRAVATRVFTDGVQQFG